MRKSLTIATLTLNLISISLPVQISVLAQTAEKWPERWLSSLHMIDEQIGWAQSAEGWSGNYAKGAVGSVMRTTDSGIHWKDVRPSSSGQKFESAWLIQALTSDVAWVSTGSASDPAHSGLYRTVDGGRNWKFMTTSQIYWNQHFINANDGWSYVVSDKASYRPTPQAPERVDVHKSIDGGAIWNKVGIVDLPGFPTGFTMGSRSLSFVNTNTGWIAGFGGDESNCCAPGSPCAPPARLCSYGIFQFVTRDGGHSWQRQLLPIPSEFRSPNSPIKGELPRFFSASDGIVILVYNGPEEAGVVLNVTRDGGVSWKSTTPHIWKTDAPVCPGWVPGYWSSSFADIDHVWVTDACALHVTSGGGRQWTIVRPGPFFNGMTLLDFISPKVGWATCPALCKPTLLKTTDGGSTWKDMSFSILR